METTQALDFTIAELHLRLLIIKYIEGGSLGVLHFTKRLRPILVRLESGERSHELYELIIKEN
jgi:hypothetical protein